MDSVRMAATNTVGMVEEVAVTVEVAEEVAEDMAVAVVVEEDHNEKEDEEPVAEALDDLLP